jgi:hypothetical protein
VRRVKQKRASPVLDALAASNVLVAEEALEKRAACEIDHYFRLGM